MLSYLITSAYSEPYFFFANFSLLQSKIRFIKFTQFLIWKEIKLKKKLEYPQF